MKEFKTLESVARYFGNVSLKNAVEEFKLIDVDAYTLATYDSEYLESIFMSNNTNTIAISKNNHRLTLEHYDADGADIDKPISMKY